MRVGIALLPEQDWAADAKRWKRVEAYGFDHGWLLDHLAWRSLADSPWFATVPILAGAALATSSLRLGTIVTTPNFRHPVPLAKELMTLDMMSGGRLTIGLGAGAPGHDARMLGQADLSPRQSSARFHEFITLLDLLLRQRRTTWRGEWFAAVEARTIPGPVQQPRPPFVVAANGRRLTAQSRWASPRLAAIRAFAGDDITAAVTEPEAFAVLHHNDPTVVHRDVVVHVWADHACRGRRDLSVPRTCQDRHEQGGRGDTDRTCRRR